jgi:iron complex transport system ATP-binding protein
MSLISVEGVGFSYGEQPVLRDIGFQVEEAEVFCLLGPNGCGKTTLLDCILGLHPLESGRITLNGLPTAGTRPAALAKAVSYVPQGHERTFPYKVLEIVMMGRAAYTGLFSGPRLTDREIAGEALEAVGIGHLRDRPYTRLSGGEGQLVLIARALAQQAPAVVMDEPTAHLDFRNELLVLETISRLVREKRIAVVMATHFPNHAFFFENDGVRTRVAMLKDTRILEMGAPDAVLRPELIQTLYGIEAAIVSLGDGNGKSKKQVVPLRTAPPAPMGRVG